MNKIVRTLALLTAVLIAPLTLSGCFEKVPAGTVGVKVHLLGGEKGVDNETIGPGRYWIGWNEELYLFPTFTQNATYSQDSSFSFQDRDGMKLTTDLGVAYFFDPAKISEVFQRYRKGTEEITSIVLRNAVRDALVSEASKLRVDQIYGPDKEKLIQAVETKVRSQFDPIGIKVERLYWIGAFDLPPEVTEMINAKINASQITLQKNQEVETAKADAQKKIEEARGKAESILLEAKAQAEANRLLTESISDELVKYKAIEKWQGELPKVTGGAMPFIDVGGLAQDAQKD